MEQTNEQIAVRVSYNTIIGNAVLTVFKLLAGIFGNSTAMISDAVHSLSDVLSTVIVIVSVRISNKSADKEHPYGHERFECVAAVLLSVILCATGLGIGYGGFKSIISGDYLQAEIPGALALSAAVISIVLKEVMYRYTRAAARRINSGALMADAWHHRSDALSSIGSFIGILGSIIGFPFLDSAACIVICLFIVKAAYDIFKDAIDKMTDRSCTDETLEEIRALILSQTGVAGVDLLQTRLFGNKIYIDVEISVDADKSLRDSHEIAHTVHDALENQISGVKHCMVHINPYQKEEATPE